MSPQSKYTIIWHLVLQFISCKTRFQRTVKICSVTVDLLKCKDLANFAKKSEWDFKLFKHSFLTEDLYLAYKRCHFEVSKCLSSKLSCQIYSIPKVSLESVLIELLWNILISWHENFSEFTEPDLSVAF